MPLHDLPTEVLVNIFGLSDSFRTATALSTVNRRFHSIWKENLTAILREITRAVVPLPREANLLADLYEENDPKCYKDTFHVQSLGERAVGAISRVMLLTDELKLMKRLAESAIGLDQVNAEWGMASALPRVLLEEPEIWLKQAYQVVTFILGLAKRPSPTDLLLFSARPCSISRRVLRTIRMGDLRLLLLTLPLLGGRNYEHQHVIRTKFLRYPQDEVAEHFWKMLEGDNLSGHMLRLSSFLSKLLWSLNPETPHADSDNTDFQSLDVIKKKVQQWEDHVRDYEVEDVLALASFCTLEGDYWKIDFSQDFP